MTPGIKGHRFRGDLEASAAMQQVYPCLLRPGWRSRFQAVTVEMVPSPETCSALLALDVSVGQRDPGIVEEQDETELEIRFQSSVVT